MKGKDSEVIIICQPKSPKGISIMKLMIIWADSQTWETVRYGCLSKLENF